MILKRSLLLLLPVLLMSRGSRSKNTFTVKGVITNPQKKAVTLNRVDVDRLVLVDSSSIRSNRNFNFKVKSEGPEFYQSDIGLGFYDIAGWNREKKSGSFSTEKTFPRTIL